MEKTEGKNNRRYERIFVCTWDYLKNERNERTHVRTRARARAHTHTHTHTHTHRERDEHVGEKEG